MWFCVYLYSAAFGFNTAYMFYPFDDARFQKLKTRDRVCGKQTDEI